MDKLQRSKILGGGVGAKPVGFADCFYVGELELQAKFGMSAFGEICNRVEAGSRDLAIFAFCHMVLTFSGNVSKLLFSESGTQATERATRLRGELGITESSVLRIRTARNYLEHFDERLDKYLGKVDGVLLHRRIDASRTTSVTLDDGRVLPASYMLFFNTTTFELEFLSETVSLREIERELTGVHAHAVAWQAKQQRLVSPTDG